MLLIKRKTYQALVQMTVAPGTVTGLGKFSSDLVARKAAMDRAKELGPGYRYDVEEADLDIVIFDTLEEYQDTQTEDLLKGAKAKLTDVELAVLADHLLNNPTTRPKRKRD